MCGTLHFPCWNIACYWYSDPRTDQIPCISISAIVFTPRKLNQNAIMNLFGNNAFRSSYFLFPFIMNNENCYQLLSYIKHEAIRSPVFYRFGENATLFTGAAIQASSHKSPWQRETWDPCTNNWKRPSKLWHLSQYMLKSFKEALKISREWEKQAVKLFTIWLNFQTCVYMHWTLKTTRNMEIRDMRDAKITGGCNH